MRKFTLLTLVALGFSISIYSQSFTKNDKILLYEAEFYFDEENYLKAIPYFEELYEKYPDDIEFKKHLGICYMHDSKKREKAIPLFQSLLEDEYEKMEAKWLLARTYHLSSRFKKAFDLFQEYITENDLSDEQLRKANHHIKYCESGMAIIPEERHTNITGLSPILNTPGFEYSPVISPDETMIIFTYRGEKCKGGKRNKKGKPDPKGEYYEDIFFSQKVDGKWTEPASIGDNINTEGHDACIALSIDGQQLFIYRSTKKDHGDIYVSHLDGDLWSTPERIAGDINTEFWEGSVSLSPDGKKMYFASARPKGIGKRDLYTADIQEDGSWGNVKNMGPIINSPYNEDAPFIHPDGRTLYFSSEGHTSMGGYDIFYTKLEDGIWSPPVNVGHSINTPDDERFYVVSADGQRGYFASSKRSGNGGHDIFIVKPGGFGLKPILCLVLGYTTLDDKPKNAKITVTDEIHEKHGEFESNSATGKYTIALEPGRAYYIKVEMDGFPPKIQKIDASNLKTYVKVPYDFAFYTNKPEEEMASLQKALNSEVRNKQGEEMVKTEIVKSENAEISCTRDVTVTAAREFTVDLYLKKKLLNSAGRLKEKIPSEFVPKIVKNEGSTFSLVDNVINFVWQNMPEKDSLHISYQLVSEVDMYDTFTISGQMDYVHDEKIKILNTDTTTFAIVKRENGFETYASNTTPENFGNDRVALQISESVNKESDELRKNGVTVTESEKNSVLDKFRSTNKKTIKKLIASNKLDQAVNQALLFENRKGEIWGLIANYSIDVIHKMEKESEILISDERLEDIKDNLMSMSLNDIANESLKENTITLSEPMKNRIEKDMRIILKDDLMAAEPCKSVTTIDASSLKGKDLNNKDNYKKLLMVSGNYCNQNLIYKVQIGAYRKPENFKYSKFEKFGETNIKKGKDGITRFTISQFKTLSEADNLRMEMVKTGQKDAWIVPYYQGERTFLEKLIEEDFYSNQLGIN